MDWENQPEIVQQGRDYAIQAFDLAREWLLTPAAWSQFALLVAAYLVALVFSRKLKPILRNFLTPPEEQEHSIARARRF